MARRHGPLRVALLALLGCAAPPGPPAVEPILPEDLAALPAAVTPENAAAVLRKCLQRHAAGASDVHRRWGYRFFDDGFEQVLAETFSDGRRDRRSSRRLRFAELPAPQTATRVDPTRLRRVTELAAGTWSITFDDPDTALALAAALKLLAKGP